MRRGFTLIEMLLVIGIIALLAGAGLMTFGGAGKRAMNAHCQELVHNAATALSLVAQGEAGCPRAILAANRGEHKMTSDVGATLACNGLMALNYRVDEGSLAGYRLVGADQCGVVTPWAAAVARRLAENGSVPKGAKVPSGGTVDDHILRFSVDDDEDGIVEAERDGRKVRVRGSAAVWCCGADGKLGTKDDIFSWSAGQEVQ